MALIVQLTVGRLHLGGKPGAGLPTPWGIGALTDDLSEIAVEAHSKARIEHRFA